MRTAIIINNINNLPLLRFTEAKLFFDAKNQAIDFVDDCVIVDSMDQANSLADQLGSVVILHTGDFLTTNFRNCYNTTTGIIYATGPDVIKFDPDTYIGFKKRCHYLQGSKQLYIIENFLKTYLRSRSLVYLDNTETIESVLPAKSFKHLFGLASGWKTIMLANNVGIEKLESITVYDANLEQLNHAKWIHKNPLISQCPTYKNVYGEYNTTNISKEVWNKWSKYPVSFKQINLFSKPVFPKQSLIWISNVFRYEPNIFDFGWKMCKNTLIELKEMNKDSYII